MKLIYEFVHPLDRKTFRIHILKCIALQILLAAVVYIVTQNRGITLETLIQNKLLYWVYTVHFVMLVFAYDIDRYAARFKDIYPELKLNAVFYFMAGFVPVFFYVMTFFLCVKPGDSERQFPRVFKARYVALVFAILLPLQAALFYEADKRITSWATDSQNREIASAKRYTVPFGTKAKK